MGKSLGNREGSDDIASRYDALAWEYDERFQSRYRDRSIEALKRLKKERLFVAMAKLGTLRTFERQELLTLFEQTKLKPTRTLGLRVISDYLFYAQKAPPEDVETLKELELLLSKPPDWDSIGRFHFFICRKP